MRGEAALQSAVDVRRMLLEVVNISRERLGCSCLVLEARSWVRGAPRIGPATSTRAADELPSVCSQTQGIAWDLGDARATRRDMVPIQTECSTQSD
jgi:hypothetical protein